MTDMKLDINTSRPEYEKLQAVMDGISDKQKTYADNIRKNVSSLKSEKTACEQRLKAARQEMLTAQISGDTSRQKQAEAEISTLTTQENEISQHLENYSGIDVFGMLLPEFDAVRAAVLSSKAADEESRREISAHIERLEKLDQEIQDKIRHYGSVRDISAYENGARELSYLFASLLGVSYDATIVKLLLPLFGFYSDTLDNTRSLPEQIRDVIAKYGTTENDY